MSKDVYFIESNVTSKSGTMDVVPQIESEPFSTPYHCQADFECARYDVFPFNRHGFIITPDGDVILHRSNIVDFVAVKRNWYTYRNNIWNMSKQGGYLGKGTRKWSFTV
ncbi:MAG TPA: hypothetical protein VGO47_14650 [Chlamydiales bacterium]|nr:hypothetical protein [Chlamydiales bacterium]